MLRTVWSETLIDAPLEDLLRQVALENTKAFEAFYARTSAKTMSIVLAIIGDRQTAEDLLQEIYLRVWSDAARFDPARGRPMTWLITIARSRTIDRLRTERRRPQAGGIEEIESLHDPSPSAEDAVAHLESVRRLTDCLNAIATDRRQCIQLAYFRGYTHTELAARLNVPLGTIKSWIRRGLQQLNECLSQ